MIQFLGHHVGIVLQFGGTRCFLFQIMVSQGKKKLGEMRHNKKIWNRDINQPNNLCPTNMWMRCQTIQYIPIG